MGKNEKKEISKSALNNLFQLSNKALPRAEAIKRYQNLSPEAREEVNDWVNKRYNMDSEVPNNMKNIQLDPNQQQHKKYVEMWLKKRDMVLGTKSNQEWETIARTKHETTYFSKDTTPTPRDTLRKSQGILEQRLDGKEFSKYVSDRLQEATTYSGKIGRRNPERRIAVMITTNLFENDAWIQNAVSTREGRDALRRLQFHFGGDPIERNRVLNNKEKEIYGKLSKVNEPYWQETTADREKNIQNFKEGFPRLSVQIQKNLEGKGYQVDKIFYRNFTGNTIEIRAEVTKETQISSGPYETYGYRGDPDTPTTKTERKEISVGGINTASGRFLDASYFEKLGTIKTDWDTQLALGELAVLAGVGIRFALYGRSVLVKKSNIVSREIARAAEIESRTIAGKLDDTVRLTRRTNNEVDEITKEITRKISTNETPSTVPSQLADSNTAKITTPSRARITRSLDTVPSQESELIFADTFTESQIRNWKADNFWKTPEQLKAMRGRDGFNVVIDKKSDEVIAAYLNDSEEGLTTGLRADGHSKLFDAKFDLVVRPDIRGKGIGGEVLKKTLEDARTYGAEHIRFHASNSGSYRWFNRMNPVESTAEGSGGRVVFKVDDLERRLRPRESLPRTRTGEAMMRSPVSPDPVLENELRSIELDPDLVAWRADRRVTSEEFQNWVRNLPEDTQKEFQLRLKEGPQLDSVGNRRFVLRDAAHEIRVNKDLREIGIKEVHGDFAGPGGKHNKEIANALSSKKTRAESEAVKKGIEDHGRGKNHHDPKSADDYLHKAIDEYDAVTDPLRDIKKGFGYKDPPMSPDDIKRIFIDNEGKSDLDKKAMEIVLGWKQGKISAEDVRREYKIVYDKIKSSERLDDTVTLRVRSKDKSKIQNFKDNNRPTIKDRSRR